MGAEDGTNIGSGDLEPTEISLVERLLEIIAVEGLVKPKLLEPHSKVDDIGFTIDDLTLIGNAIEREYDCDMMPDEAMQRCKTVRELVELIGQRIQSAGNRE
jgi:acyl carrier protein